MSATRSDLNAILENLARWIAQEVKGGLDHLIAFQSDEKHYRSKVCEELDNLKDQVDVSKLSDSTSKGEVLKRIAFDLEKVLAFKQFLISKPANLLMTPVRYNQLPSIVRSSQRLAEEHFDILFETNALNPMGYDYTQSQVTWLGDPDPHAFYGTARVSPLKDVYLRMLLQQQNKHYFHEIENLSPVLAETYPISSSSELFAEVPDLSLCAYFNKGGATSTLTMPHNFYELGGGHENNSYTQDCSAYVSRYTTGFPFLTLHLHSHAILSYEKMYNISLFKGRQGPLPMTGDMSHALSLVNIRDPQTDIKPGMVVSTREIEKDNHEGQQQILGVRGHTTFIVSEVRSDGSFWTGGCERRLKKNIDGLGYSKTSIDIPPSHDTEKFMHFFKVQPRSKVLHAKCLSQILNSRRVIFLSNQIFSDISRGIHSKSMILK